MPIPAACFHSYIPTWLTSCNTDPVTPRCRPFTTSTKPEKGKVLVQVDQNVLKANAMCNSEMDPAISWDSASNYTKNIDGQAEYAFDGDERLGTSSDKITGGMWHSRYTNTSITVIN